MSVIDVIVVVGALLTGAGGMVRVVCSGGVGRHTAVLIVDVEGKGGKIGVLVVLGIGMVRIVGMVYERVHVELVDVEVGEHAETNGGSAEEVL